MAANIASGNTCRAGTAVRSDLGNRLLELGERARSMLRSALEAPMDMDADAACEVPETADEVDAMCIDFSATIKAQLTANPSGQAALVSWLMAAKAIERVADHATNIAEDTIYSVEGEIFRHGLS